MKTVTENPFSNYKYKIEEMLSTRYDSKGRAAAVKRITKEKKIISERRFIAWKQLQKGDKTEIRLSDLDAIAVEFGLGNDGRLLINETKITL